MMTNERAPPTSKHPSFCRTSSSPSARGLMVRSGRRGRACLPRLSHVLAGLGECLNSTCLFGGAARSADRMEGTDAMEVLTILVGLDNDDEVARLTYKLERVMN